jgi:hypothetical protein
MKLEHAAGAADFNKDNHIIGAGWVDGSQVDYGNPVGLVPGTWRWAQNANGWHEPNNAMGNENCVQMRREGWFNVPCDLLHPTGGFVCQKM